MSFGLLQRYLILLTNLGGLASLLLGGVVLLGWYTHNTSLIQVNPAFVAMQYNTALGFMLSGVVPACWRWSGQVHAQRSYSASLCC